MKILGVRVDNVTMSEAVEKVGQMIEAGGKHYVVTPNSEFIVDAQKDEQFKKVLNKAALSIPDGIGVVFASQLYGEPLKKRVAGTDLVEALCKKAAEEGWSVFFLGGLYRVGEKSAEILRKRYPELNVCGFYEGKREEAYDAQALQGIKRASKGRQKIDILFVAYGHDHQERWISRNLDKLNVSVAVGVGGAFDFISGFIPRAPLWMRRLGLEWLFRLIKQPWRWGRIFKAVIVFPFLIMKDVMTNANGPRKVPTSWDNGAQRK